MVEALTVLDGPGWTERPLPHLVLKHAGERPDEVAVRHRRGDRWVDLTWSDYADRAIASAAGLLELGLSPAGHVAIFAEGRVEWLISQTAIGLAGGVTVGCYPTSSLEDLRHTLGHGDAQIVICGDSSFADKVGAIWGDLPRLMAIVQMDAGDIKQDSGIISFEKLEQLGFLSLATNTGLLDRLLVQRPLDDVALMVYTSGSTGPPKGALLTYRNMKCAAEGLLPRIGLGPGSIVLSYLPLCHIAEQAMTNIGPLYAAATVCLGGGLPTLTDDLRAVRPTYFSGVPRVWQKIRDEITQRFIAVGKERDLHAALDAGEPLAFKLESAWSAEQRLAIEPHLGLMSEARRLVGLDRAKVVTSGAAPLHLDHFTFFRALRFPLLELYGMTEACSILSVQRPDRVVPGTVGGPVDTVQLALAEDGEILVRGENVFAGYYKDVEASAIALEGGWLHTGDVGVFEAGQLRIVDRKKDIMITEGGKNIAPAEVEALIRSSPLIQECVLVADRRKYVAALIQLDPAAFGHSPDPATMSSLTARPDVQAQIAREINRLNSALARVTQIKRAHLLENPLSQTDGDLTPTLKLRRFRVHQRHAETIEALYAGELGFDIVSRNEPAQPGGRDAFRG